MIITLVVPYVLPAEDSWDIRGLLTSQSEHTREHKKKDQWCTEDSHFVLIKFKCHLMETVKQLNQSFHMRILFLKFLKLHLSHLVHTQNHFTLNNECH